MTPFEELKKLTNEVNDINEMDKLAARIFTDYLFEYINFSEAESLINILDTKKEFIQNKN